MWKTIIRIFFLFDDRRLDSNALICDCQMLWLAKMLNEKQGTTQVAAICQSPDELSGRSVTSLIEEFNCSECHVCEAGQIQYRTINIK